LLIADGVTFVLILLNTNSIYYKQAYTPRWAWLALPGAETFFGLKVPSELIYGL
jgi:hypothetical protein